MLLVVGLAMADARPIELGGEARLAMPVVALTAAGVIGYLLARSRLGVVRAHLVGAVAAACVLLLSAATAVGRGVGPLTTDLDALREQLSSLGLTVETEASHFLDVSGDPPAVLTYLVLGAVCWTTGQFSAFSVFRYRRGGPAILASGTLLFLNELLPAPSVTPDRLPVLLVLSLFAVLAMLLLVRLQLAAQGALWARRQIADSAEVRRLFLRSGAVFVLLAVLGATSLSAIATAPPQRIDDGLLEGPLEELREALGGWLTLFAIDPSPPGVTLEDRLEVADEWQQGDGVAFVAEVEAPGLRGNYWWLSAWADFDGRSWSREATTTDEVQALVPIEVPADASGAGPTDVRASITPRRSRLALGTLLAPSEPLEVDRAVRVRSLGDREGLTEITFTEELLRGASYRVTSAAWDYAAPQGTLTAARLRAAGRDYPAWMERYLRIEAGASGPRTARLARDVVAEAGRLGLANPFDVARILQDRLRSLEYRTSVEGLCDAGENVPECLLRSGAGFCQHFASTMVMALRETGIPARLVSGYLPGTLGADGRYEVPLQALHAWVEVYFPGTGWIRFDPTPGDQLRVFEQQATDLPEGQPLGSPAPSGSPAAPDAGASAGPSPTASPSPMVVVPPVTFRGDGVRSGLLLVGGLVLLLLLSAAGLVLIRLRRLPEADGGLAWARVAWLATRLGHGPHPAQTEYEYAGSLAEALPSIRDDLYVVADARVAQRYGRHEVPGDRRKALRRAYARVRTALLRLGLGRHRR